MKFIRIQNLVLNAANYNFIFDVDIYSSNKIVYVVKAFCIFGDNKFKIFESENENECIRFFNDLAQELEAIKMDSELD